MQKTALTSKKAKRKLISSLSDGYLCRAVGIALPGPTTIAAGLAAENQLARECLEDVAPATPENQGIHYDQKDEEDGKYDHTRKPEAARVARLERELLGRVKHLDARRVHRLYSYSYQAQVPVVVGVE